MPDKVKKSILIRLRNYFITGAIVLIPIGITIYLTLFIIRISSNFLPKKINPNNYLPFDIPGIEILITIMLITFIGGLSLSCRFQVQKTTSQQVAQTSPCAWWLAEGGD